MRVHSYIVSTLHLLRRPGESSGVLWGALDCCCIDQHMVQYIVVDGWNDVGRRTGGNGSIHLFDAVLIEGEGSP